MSWVTLDRICQERVDKDGVRLQFVRNGRPLRSSADSLSDDELLAKLKDLGGSGKKFKKCCGSPAEVRRE
jgi:hypothetical protein